MKKNSIFGYFSLPESFLSSHSFLLLFFIFFSFSLLPLLLSLSLTVKESDEEGGMMNRIGTRKDENWKQEADC